MTDRERGIFPLLALVIKYHSETNLPGGTEPALATRRRNFRGTAAMLGGTDDVCRASVGLCRRECIVIEFIITSSAKLPMSKIK